MMNTEEVNVTFEKTAMVGIDWVLRWTYMQVSFICEIETNLELLGKIF